MYYKSFNGKKSYLYIIYIYIYRQNLVYTTSVGLAQARPNYQLSLMPGLRYATVYREKTSLYLLCDDYVLSIADGTSVSTFLCTPVA